MSYVQYRVWPDGTYVLEDDYREADYAHISDDFTIITIDIADDDNVAQRIANTIGWPQC